MTQSPNILHLRFNSPASGFAQNANLSQEIEAMRWLAGLFIHQSCSWQSKHDKPHRMMKGNYSPRNVENSLVSSVCHHLCAHVFEDPKIHVDRTELCLPWLVDLKHDYRFFFECHWAIITQTITCSSQGARMCWETSGANSSSLMPCKVTSMTAHRL